MRLVIGNKNYSSWSLRAWLLLAANDLAFEEIRVLLSVEKTSSEIAKYSQAGKVPVLHDGDLIVWDSLAICEYISEQYLEGRGWPEEKRKRAQARSCAAEMHSGFFALRNDMPMNCRAAGRKVSVSRELEKDITRIDQLWTQLRRENSVDGPWLFGKFSIADCMFAPVVFRFATYGVTVSQESQDYMATMLSNPKVKEWLRHAENEKEVIEETEVGR